MINQKVHLQIQARTESIIDFMGIEHTKENHNAIYNALRANYLRGYHDRGLDDKKAHLKQRNEIVSGKHLNFRIIQDFNQN